MDDVDRMDELVTYAARQAKALETIRNVVLGFVVLAVLGVLFWVALLRG